VKAAGGLPVTIRTIDVGGDKALRNYHSPDEKNPLLGQRAIRFSLSMPDMFKCQLRAILRASVHGPVRIMFPLISCAEEMDSALLLLEEAKSELRAKNTAFDEGIQAGAMIEVPSAALTADIIAKRCDFFSIGTNDLLQYTTACDRTNEKVNGIARPEHPAMFRLLKMTIEAAHGAGIPAAVCGELGGSPEWTRLLVGLGADELSMSAPRIPAVKKMIRSVNLSDCVMLAEAVSRCETAAEAAKLLVTA
jgi:phosphotransferase system enzyme I (PtsI)